MSLNSLSKGVLLIGAASAVLAAPDASAQSSSSRTAALFGRLMERRIDSLAREPAIAARVHGQRGLALMQASGDSALYFIDDDAMREMSLLFSESAARATPSACAQLYLGGGNGFSDAWTGVMQFADSALVDRWASFMVRVIRAGIVRPPLGRLASATEVTAVLRRLVAEQPAADRPRLQRGAAKTGDVRDACFYTVTMYRQLGSLPAKEGGPVLRAMMWGVQPRLDGKGPNE